MLLQLGHLLLLLTFELHLLPPIIYKPLLVEAIRTFKEYRQSVNSQKPVVFRVVYHIYLLDVVLAICCGCRLSCYCDSLTAKVVVHLTVHQSALDVIVDEQVYWQLVGHDLV